MGWLLRTPPSGVNTIHANMNKGITKILLSLLEQSLHDRRNSLRKNNESTCCPRGIRQYGRVSMKSINMHIGHDSSVGVCFANIPAYFV